MKPRVTGTVQPIVCILFLHQRRCWSQNDINLEPVIEAPVFALPPAPHIRAVSDTQHNSARYMHVTCQTNRPVNPPALLHHRSKSLNTVLRTTPDRRSTEGCCGPLALHNDTHESHPIPFAQCTDGTAHPNRPVCDTLVSIAYAPSLQITQHRPM